MRYLIVAPQLGFESAGELVPGGLLTMGRCVARVLASSPSIEKLGIWSQVDPPGTEPMIESMVRVYAHSALDLDVRSFGGSRFGLASAVAWACLRRTYDRIIYLLVNQSVLSVLPWHPPYAVWEIGEELFQPVSWSKYRALSRADVLLSISRSTSDIAIRNNPGLPQARVVHLCVEPPLFKPDPLDNPVTKEAYDPASRDRAVFIVANMHRRLLYKGHQQLIAGWPEVVQMCPDAELWIGGDGDGRPVLEAQAQSLPNHVAKRIFFLGWLDEASLHQRYQRCRVFAMPSRGEGFGLVFVEAARYGIPCVGGKYDSVKEIVLHNETGLLVEQNPHDVALACARLLTDDELAKRLGEAGRQRHLGNFRFRHFRERLLRTLGLDLGVVE